MKKELLLKLADLLDTVPDAQFDYASWVGGKQGQVGTCGTTACALGWATTMPETGLKVVGVGVGSAPFIVHESFLDKDWAMPYARGIQAARLAFDLTEEQSDALFYPSYWCASTGTRSPGENAHPKSVASWIRRVVAAEGGEA